MNRYESAREQYRAIGVDTEKALETLAGAAVSIHCWQGDDINGFENTSSLSGGIQVTGNYPGKAQTPEQLMADLDKAMSLIPGKHRINLHAIYPVTGEKVERDKLEPRHFEAWVAFAKERSIGLDFNPTLFAHPMADTGLTLSSPDDNVRRFWIDHCKATRKIAAYFGKELGSPCLHNIWIPDGFKEIPADRIGPRRRLKQSLDEIFSVKYDPAYIVDSVESKVFGIGVEACTVGSHEFYMNYAAKNNLLCLLDNGHFHPTEAVSDKIPSMLLFADQIALHVTRPMRWDSDHVVLLDDELKNIAAEIVRCDALERVLIGLDYFDASVNRVAAWVVGTRNMYKALLDALLTPHQALVSMQDRWDFTHIMALREELKTFPMGDVWDEFCRRQNVPVGMDWISETDAYEKNVLSQRT